LRTKFIRIVGSCGFAPDPICGAYSALQTPQRWCHGKAKGGKERSRKRIIGGDREERKERQVNKGSKRVR